MPGAGAEQRHARLGREPPLRLEVRPERVAVEQHDGAAVQQHRDRDVPHRPGGGGEPQRPVAGADVEVQAEQPQVLEQDAAVAVDDRLRQPGGARGEQHVERVVERDLVEGQLPGLGEQLVPRHRVGHGVRPVVQPDDVPDARQPLADRGQLVALVDLLGRRTGTTRRRAAPSARAGRGGRRRCARRTPARTPPRRRPGSRRPGTPRSSRGRAAGTRRPGRRAPRRGAAGRRGRVPPGHAARRT